MLLVIETKETVMSKPIILDSPSQFPFDKLGSQVTVFLNDGQIKKIIKQLVEGYGVEHIENMAREQEKILRGSNEDY